MKLVIIESPYAGADGGRSWDDADVQRNLAYLRACMRACLLRGESPIASHAQYTAPGVLDDGNPDERTLGIEAGLAWAPVADLRVFYVDLGWSRGMTGARVRYDETGLAYEVRSLGGAWQQPERAA